MNTTKEWNMIKMLSDIRYMINIVKIIIVVSILSFAQIAYAQEIVEKKVCTVINVIDGDTISVFLEGQEESIRLIGIDTPESWENDKVIRDTQRYGIEVEEMIALGKIATTYVEVLVKPGDTLIIEFDKQIRDEYGRLLGFVFLDDGRMLNEEILRVGYAEIITIPPNVMYIKRLYNAYLNAKENGRGFWN